MTSDEQDKEPAWRQADEQREGQGRVKFFYGLIILCLVSSVRSSDSSGVKIGWCVVSLFLNSFSDIGRRKILASSPVISMTSFCSNAINTKLN